MRHHLLLFLLLFLFNTSHAQPKRELRAAWIATVSNIDWPSKPGLSAEEQQRQFIYRLDQLKGIGCNAVIVQVRPACDAFYPCTMEPWSRYLTGKQGQPPAPYYDPLEFMIRETHKRNMEFHAWFNPFRALVDSKKNPNPGDHVTRQHSGWVISYGGKSYLDPGNPETRKYVVDVITDVVSRYDIDAVHLDDYFYPYRIAGLMFGDATSYGRYNANGLDRDDWRRENVTTFVKALNTSIKAKKPYMKLGISPFGVWRNQSKDPLGSPTRGGQTNYDDLFADIRLWLENGWIDYAMPQLYWEHFHRAAPFEVLLPWWHQVAFKRHVYYGLGMYRMLDAHSGPWASVNELLWQLRDIRSTAPGSGYALYSASNLDKIHLPLADSIKAFNKTIAIPPAMPWLDSLAPAQPVVTVLATSNGNLLKWDVANPSHERLCYLVYRFAEGQKTDIENGSAIIALTGNMEFIDLQAGRPAHCIYMVTALDRSWNESKAGQIKFPPTSGR